MDFGGRARDAPAASFFARRAAVRGNWATCRLRRWL
jgi:hypothetical protein